MRRRQVRVALGAAAAAAAGALLLLATVALASLRVDAPAGRQLADTAAHAQGLAAVPVATTTVAQASAQPITAAVIAAPGASPAVVGLAVPPLPAVTVVPAAAAVAVAPAAPEAQGLTATAPPTPAPAHEMPQAKALAVAQLTADLSPTASPTASASIQQQRWFPPKERASTLPHGSYFQSCKDCVFDTPVLRCAVCENGKRGCRNGDFSSCPSNEVSSDLTGCTAG